MNPTLAVYEPPTQAKDEVVNFWKHDRELLAPGVMGTAFVEDGLILIPLVVAVEEGSGAVGRFLDRLSARCRIISVTSLRLAGMLERRGWKKSPHEEYGDMWDRFGERLPKVCARHPKAVWFDELECPACKAEKEFLALTEKER